MKSFVFATIASMILSNFVTAAPSELPSQDLARTQAQNSLNAKLSKNIYRNEDYEANYTVSVPYETEETYYESVPYETQERVCHDNVTYRQECRTERICPNVASLSSLHINAILAATPELDGRPGFGGPSDGSQGGGGLGGGQGGGFGGGGNPPPPPPSNGGGQGGGGFGGGHGGGGNPPPPPPSNGGGQGGGGFGGGHGGGGNPPPPPPSNGGGWGGGHGGGGNPPPPPPRPCREERRCEQVPVHNQECHYEMVTRYRQEARTRTVTRYRDETRCCVTKTRSVFDHQITSEATLSFPVEAKLEASEKENFRASLDGEGKFQVKALKAIYTYEPLVSDLGGGKYDVLMKLVPTYQPAQLGPQTITDLKIVVVGGRSRIMFTDAGAVNKTHTHYSLQLIDANGAVLIEEAKDNINASQKILWDLNIPSTAGATLAARMAVSRDGIVIAAPVAFEVQANLVVQKEAAYDANAYTKASSLHHYRIAGRNAAIVVTFRDDTKVIDEVSTEYHLGIFVQEGKSARLLAEKTFKRESLALTKEGNFDLSLASDFGVSDDELARLNPGKVIALTGQAIRYGSRFKGMKAVVATSSKLTVPKN